MLGEEYYADQQELIQSDDVGIFQCSAIALKAWVMVEDLRKIQSHILR